MNEIVFGHTTPLPPRESSMEQDLLGRGPYTSPAAAIAHPPVKFCSLLIKRLSAPDKVHFPI